MSSLKLRILLSLGIFVLFFGCDKEETNTEKQETWSCSATGCFQAGEDGTFVSQGDCQAYCDVSTSSSSGSSSGGSSGSSSGGSGSSSSGGVTYMPTGTVTLVFNGYTDYFGNIELKTGPVEAPWPLPSSGLDPIMHLYCGSIEGPTMTFDNMVYFRYRISGCNFANVPNVEWMPQYQGESVTFYVP